MANGKAQSEETLIFNSELHSFDLSLGQNIHKTIYIGKTNHGKHGIRLAMVHLSILTPRGGGGGGGELDNFEKNR